jgi:hypothetical protein
MALTKAEASLHDWTALASGTVAESSEIDCSDAYSLLIHIQAFLDSTTAHTGTEFLILGASADSGDEDWYEICRFVDLVDATPDEETIDDNPWATDDLTTAVTATGDFNVGLADGQLKWIAAEDGTLVNSELMLQTDAATDTSITVLDNKANSHANTVNLYSAAMSRAIPVGIEHYRIKIVINNNYDINGSSLNYRIRYIEVTGV